MKTIGLLYILFIFFLLPGNLYPEELYSIGIRKDLAGKPISIKHYLNGKWEEEPFPAGERFEGNFSPALGISPSNEIWVVWAARKSGEKPKIYFSRRRGTTWTEPRRVTDTKNSWEMTPCITFDGEGFPAVAWSGDINDNLEIYCARWNRDGFSSGVMVSTPDLSPDLSPALATSPDGRALLIWQGWDGDYFQAYRSLYDGRNWSKEELISGSDNVDQVRPFVCYLSGGDWNCSWQEKGELLSIIGKHGTWSVPAGSRTLTGVKYLNNHDLFLTGWVIEKNDQGEIRARRSYSLFDYSDKETLPEKAYQPRKGSLGNKVYIGYGDSITYGVEGPPMGKCYIPILQADLEAAHFTTYTIYNYGYPGCNTEQLLYGGGGTYPPIRPCHGIGPVVDGYDASHILIMGGTNDYVDGFSLSLSKSCLGAMIDRARLADCEPVLATIIPCCQSNDFYEWTRDLSRNYIVPLAQEKGCLLANPFEAFIDYGSWPDLLRDDCEHPVWTEGSQVIANAWFAALSDPDPSLPLLDSGDYNGDGSSDIAIFRPASGLWAIRAITRVYFGSSSDTPAAGDYNNDGTTDITIFRGSSGLWAVHGITRAYFGGSSDLSVPGDYNGDGFCDMAVYRKSTGLWAAREITRCYFGSEGDIPIPGYYQDNRVKEIAIFRPSTGLWAARGFTRFYFGSSEDQPVAADYSGNGSEQAGIFRSGSGLWAIRGYSRFYYGSSIDRPIPASYSGTAAGAAILRETTGLWALRNVSRVYYGTANDIPVTGRVPQPITPSPTPSVIPSPSIIPTATPSPTPIGYHTPSPTPIT